MILFCPTCANMLLVQHEEHTFRLRYYCQTCPYVYAINTKVVRSAPLVRKEVEDVLGSEDQWKAMPKTEITCPRCHNHEAYYQEIQTRSADEPATLFYRCTSCHHNWKEG